MAKQRDNDEPLLKEIRESYDAFMEFWREQREQAKQDTLIMANEPFTPQEIRRRGKNRPLVITDQIGQYTNQIINNIRQNPRGVNFQPKNLFTDAKDAERRANIGRQIEKDSDAQAVYSTAFECAVAYGGMGYMRLIQEYESDDTDRQILRIGRVANHFSILPDPNASKIDFADMKRCFVLDTQSHKDFLDDYQGAKIREFGGDVKSAYPKWIFDTELQIAEYWCVKKTADTLCIMEGSTVRESRLPDGAEFQKTGEPNEGGLILQMGRDPIQVRKWRSIEPKKVWQYHTNGIEIVERLCWDEDGDSIPIYPVVGREMFVDRGTGPKKQYVSAVRYTSWAIKGMAYVRSLMVEIAQQTPKTPYMAIEGQLEGMAGWKTLHTDPAAYVYYRAKLEQFGEVLLPPPTRVPFDPSGALQGLQLLYDSMHQDLQNALGMYRASVGNDRGTTSGKMVQELDKQSDQGSYHFTHNFNQSLERLWTDANKRMSIVYDTKQEVGSLAADGTHKVEPLNDPDNDASLHMGKGEFTTSVSVGPSMESETEDARNLMEHLIGVPGVVEKCGDLLVKLNGKGPVVDAIAKRLAPAGVGDDSDPAKQQQQIVQMGQQLQELQTQLQEAGKIIQTKKVEADNREAIAKIQAAASIEVARINAAAKGVVTAAELDADLVKHATGIAADAGAIDEEHDHQKEMKGAEMAHASAESSADRTAAAEAAKKKPNGAA